MAEVRVCTVCGHINGRSEPFCNGPMPSGKPCGVPIEHIAPLDEDSLRPPAEAHPADRAGAAVELPRSEPAAQRPSAADAFGPDIGAGSRFQSTSTTREARRREAELVFAWGPERIGSRLAIGRDMSFSPLGERIQQLQKVSGIHAELTFDGARLVVRHLGRTNPTRVNGRPLETGESVEVTDGEELSFSTDLVARVRIT